jgi:hypothetical protein
LIVNIPTNDPGEKNPVEVGNRASKINNNPPPTTARRDDANAPRSGGIGDDIFTASLHRAFRLG